MPEGWEEIRALLALSRVKGLGHERLRRLLAHFGTVQAVLKASDWGCAIGKGGPWRRPGSAEFEIGPRCNGNGLAPKVVVAWSPVMRVIPSYSGRFHHRRRSFLHWGRMTW